MFLRSNLHSVILFISEQHTVVCPAAWGTGDGTCAVDDEYDYDALGFGLDVLRVILLFTTGCLLYMRLL